MCWKRTYADLLRSDLRKRHVKKCHPQDQDSAVQPPPAESIQTGLMSPESSKAQPVVASSTAIEGIAGSPHEQSQVEDAVRYRSVVVTYILTNTLSGFHASIRHVLDTEHILALSSSPIHNSVL